MKRSGWLLMLCLASAWPVMACQYRLDIAIEQFFEADAGRAVVFVGEVRTATHDGGDGDRWRVAFLPVETLWGRYDAALPVQFSRLGSKTGCEAFDPPFAPAAGSHWLIFGKLEAGVIVPDRILSHEVRGDQVDPQVRKLLKRYAPRPKGRDPS